MNILKALSLKWWQTGILKIGLLALGIAVGAYLHDIFGGYLVALAIVAALSLAYTTYPAVLNSFGCPALANSRASARTARPFIRQEVPAASFERVQLSRMQM